MITYTLVIAASAWGHMVGLILGSEAALPRQCLQQQAWGSCAVWIENIQDKVGGLRELGFTDPVEMVTSSPEILEYAIANIESKIANLRELGFTDPIRMIVSSPAILGYRIVSIRVKIADLCTMGFADP